jgi:outer membrane receptor for ferrienterochelin and colicin
MNNRLRFLSQLTIALSLLLVSVVALAQETTSAARVSLYGPDGNPVSGQSVSITDTRTGAIRTSVTNASGFASFRGLPVGGPYTVNVSSPNYANQTVTDINLSLGDTYDVVLQLGSADLEEVVVTGQMIGGEQIALGPSSTFNAQTIADMPTVDRDLRDVIRADPRVYIDPSVGGGAVQCSGANPRFNSLTVDGVRMNDLFGLNQNGYPTERQPFSYDSIEQISVELAPFDVVYGQFTACNVNAVTKSGSNEWHGSAFFEYTSDDLKGDSLEGDKLDTGNYDEKRYGATLSGAILKDKLFFFLAYEKQEASNLFDRTVFGAPTVGRVIRGVNQDQLDEIYQIAQEVYGYTPGQPVSSLPNEDEKYTIKLDWDISENHRASYTYNYNDGFNMTDSDSDDNEFEFSDHYYERGAELKSHTAALFSNWTDRFSTEVRYSNLKLDNRQISRGQNEIGEIQIRTFNVDETGATNLATVYLGTDDSRQANKLDYEANNIKLAGLYELGDHLLTFGYELDDLDIFNLFVQHTRGEYRFDEECSSTNPNGCIEAFREGRPDDIYYGNSPTLDPNDAAADFGYKTNTLYLQDEWLTLGGDLTLTFGVRYDWYSSNDTPLYNQFFFDRNGFANTETFDGADLFQPRFGFNWNITPDVSLRGGIGLYSGGNPNVWLTNSYQSNGLTNVQLRETVIERNPPPPENCGLGVEFSLFDIPLSGSGRPLYDIPQCQVDAVAFAQPNSGVNAVAPGFEIPKQWRASLGTSWTFGDGYLFNADLLLARSDDSATIIASTLVPVGPGPDGRIIYDDTRAFNSDYILTNVTGSDARSTQLAFSLSKSYENWDWSAGYAWTDAEDVNPMTSSVAFSNYASVAASDPNNPGLATSNYEIEHRFTFSVSYSAYWWGDNRTNFTFYGAQSSGRPFSYVYEGAGGVFGDDVDGRHLVYVPSGPSDPNVVFGPNFDVDAFFAYAEATGLMKYAGGIAPRNAFNSSWWTTFDLRIEQELPGFKEGHKFAAYVVFKNLCNLINDEWCVLKETDFPLMREIISTGMTADRSQYLYNEFFAVRPGRQVEASLWEIAVGLTYRF